MWGVVASFSRDGSEGPVGNRVLEGPQGTPAAAIIRAPVPAWHTLHLKCQNKNVWYLHMFETTQGTLCQSAIPLSLLRSKGSKGAAGNSRSLQAHTSPRCSWFCTRSTSTENIASTVEHLTKKGETQPVCPLPPPPIPQHLLRPSYPGLRRVGRAECKPHLLSRTRSPPATRLPSLSQQPLPHAPTVAQDPFSSSSSAGQRPLGGASSRDAICKHGPRAPALPSCSRLLAPEDTHFSREPS